MSSKLVLVAEHDPGTRRQIVTVVEAIPGARAILAQGGKEAIQLAQELNPALVLLDLGIPCLEGLRVIRRLKSQPATRPIPIVVLSAFSKARRTVLAAGCEGYLDRPLDAETLEDVVRKHVAA